MEVAENVISEKPCSVHVGVLKNAERDALEREIQRNAQVRCIRIARRLGGKVVIDFFSLPRVDRI